MVCVTLVFELTLPLQAYNYPMSNDKLFGDRSDVPSDLKDLGSNIIYWSKPNPNAPIGLGIYLSDICIRIPCAWPMILLLSPCLVPGVCRASSIALSTSLVLTTSSLVIKADDAEAGGDTRIINLHEILTIEVTTNSDNPIALDCCIKLNRLKITDAEYHSTTILAHDNLEDFRDRIMQAKERLPKPSPQIMQMQQVMKYDEEEAPVPKYDEEEAPVPKYDEEEAPVPKYDEEEAPKPKYDEEEAPVPKYDEEEAPKPKYDEEEAPVPKYDEEEAPKPKYDEERAP
jgi:hypothetical protein